MKEIDLVEVEEMLGGVVLGGGTNCPRPTLPEICCSPTCKQDGTVTKCD